MKLSRILIVLAALAAGSVLAYTMPGATPYDGLITFDHGAMPLVPNALHINGGIGYVMTSKGFNDDSEAVDLVDDLTLLAIPIDIGYAFDERWRVDITPQLLRPAMGDTSVMGLGDLWVKTSAIWETAAGFYVGPRLGIKAPLGKTEDIDIPLGDKQMDIDFAAIAAKYGESAFKADAALGFRYRMKRTDTIEMGIPLASYDVDLTPGMMIYLDANLGMGLGGDQKWQIYVPVGFFTTMEDKYTVGDDWPANVTEPEGMSYMGVYAGLWPKYVIDENTNVGLKVEYPFMGKNTPQGMLVALTADAFIPL